MHQKSRSSFSAGTRNSARHHRRPVWLLLICFALCAAALAGSGFFLVNRTVIASGSRGKVVPAHLPQPTQDSGALPAVAVQQITALEAEKESRTPAQQKIASQLLQAVRESRGQKMAVGVDLAPANVDADAKGNLKIDIYGDVSDDLIARIEGLGGKIIFPSWEYNQIRAQVNLSVIETIAGYSEVKFIQPAVRSMTSRPRAASKPAQATLATGAISQAGPGTSSPAPRPSFAERAARVRSQLSEYLAARTMAPTMMPTGTVDSEGDRAHRADDTRNAFGYAGAGIRIGVLSDSFNNGGGAAADIASGNLPGPGNPLGNTTPVTVIQDLGAGGSDEGRAMVQIVHDLAPKAQLFFATADISEPGFATNITALRGAPNNCDIIIDDIFYFDESPFQDGVIAQAVNMVTASGGLYFSSAGNEGSVAKGTAGYFEGDFNDAGSPAFTFPGGAKVGTIHNFGTVGVPINGDIITLTGEAYTLNWADPAGASNNDYDLFLLSSTGAVKGSSTNTQSGTQNPFEQITVQALVAGDRLAVFKRTTAAPLAFAINTLRGTLNINTTGQTHGHSCAVDAFGVAAAPAAGPFGPGQPVGPFPNAFSAASQVETFTSDGPRRVFFNFGSTTPITPGNLLFATNGGAVRNKPDITAADGVSTTGNGLGAGLNPFYGTSAAAPHAGAIAALLKSANPALTSAQIRTILTTTAVDVESPGYDNISGFGILQAFQAMQAVSPTAQSNIITGTMTVTEGTFSNGNGQLDPGEIANITVQLINPAALTATGVNATLTTSTPGVTVVQGSASYGDIAAGSSATNSATPFVIGVSSTVPCGTTITFVLTATFGNGPSPQSFLLTTNVGSQPFSSISGTLGSPPPTGAGFTSTSGTQMGRISRSGVGSTCAALKANPGLIAGDSAPRQFDAYTFTNTSGNTQCVTVTFTSPNGANLYSAAYTSAGFVPSNPSTNFLADPGTSSTTTSYSFNVAAGVAFTVTAYDVTSGPPSGSTYTLSLSLSNCSAPGGTCTPVNESPVGTIASGTTGTPYSQTFTATGGSGFYNFALTGALPSGLSFSSAATSAKITGTPTVPGSFPITVTANDVAGCPGATQNYTLVVTGGFIGINSTAAGGPWSSTDTWVGGVVPTSTDDVIITDGSIVTIDTAAVAQSLRVGTGGSLANLVWDSTTARTLNVGTFVIITSNGVFQSPATGAITTHLLTVGTDLTNNGVLDFSTNQSPLTGQDSAGAGITFTGAANNTFGGTGATTDIRALTINKGISPANILELNPSNFTVLSSAADVAGFLTLTNGTLKISGAFTDTNRVFTTAGYTIAATTGFWLNNPNFTVAGQNGSPTEAGLLRITQGTFNIGVATGNSMGFNAGSNIIVEGGAVNATGRFGVAAATNAINYTQTAGTITVCTIGNGSSTLGSFDLGTGAGTNVTISGGTIVVQLASTAATPIDYRYDAGSTIANMTGGTLQMGNDSSGAAKAFNIRGVVPNLVISNTSAGHSATLSTTLVRFNHVALSVTINTGTTFNIGNSIFILLGNTVNNGTLTGAGSSRYYHNGTVPQTYSGTGVTTAPLASFEVDNIAGVTITAVNQQVVGRVILFTGGITGANKLTLGNGGATTGVVQIGNTTTPTNAGTFDVAPTFNLGTGGEVISYLRTTLTRSTGPEINPARTLTSMTYDDNDPTHALTITGGDLTLSAAGVAATMTNGRIITGANTLALSSSTATVTRTNGYVDGNFRKTFTTVGLKTFEVGTANAYSPVTVNPPAGVPVAGTFTVKATQGPHPSVNPATSVQRFWTLTNGGLFAADLTFAYVAADVQGTEANYKVIRISGGTPVAFPTSTVNTATHIATLTGVTAFSDWTVGEITSPTASNSSIAGRITDPSGAPVAGTTINLNGTQSAETITDNNGNYSFASVPTNGFYTVTPALVNYTFSPVNRSFSLVANKTDAVFTALPNAVPTANPIDTNEYFVRQQYQDFLGREPDQGGLAFWTSKLSQCNGDAGCLSRQRVEVSAAFFQSQEFNDTGSYVYRLYQGGLGRQLSYNEFVSDRQQVVGGANLETSKASFASAFVTRAEFVGKYQANTTAESFVDALLQTLRDSAGVDLSGERSSLIDHYNAGGTMNEGRGLVVRDVAENAAFASAVYNPSFVLMEYFGYLRRGAEAEGYAFWLNVLNTSDAGNYRGMVCSFLTSTEYQHRFGTVVTRSNTECGH